VRRKFKRFFAECARGKAWKRQHEVCLGVAAYGWAYTFAAGDVQRVDTAIAWLSIRPGLNNQPKLSSREVGGQRCVQSELAPGSHSREQTARGYG